MNWFDTGMEQRKADAEKQMKRCRKLLAMDRFYQGMSIDDCDPSDTTELAWVYEKSQPLFDRTTKAVLFRMIKYLLRSNGLTEPMKKFLDILEDHLWTRDNAPGLKACNYCLHQYYKKLAERKEFELSVLDGMGGVEIYMHPTEIDARKIIPDSPEHKKYHMCWFMKLGNHCSC